MEDVNIPNDSFKLIQNLSKKYPELKNVFDEIDSYLNQRLWFQLSENLLALSANPKLQQSSDLIEIYNGLVFFIESTLNPMKYLIYVQNMLHNYKGKMDEALKLVENIENTHKHFKGEAKISIQLLKGYCYLDLNKMYDLEEIVKDTENEFSKNSQRC